MSSNPALDRALAYARRGWPVFPCHPGEKTPATTHGYRDATTDPAQITAWYTRRPDANLAIATGHPGPDVLDVDDYGPGRNGYGALAQLRDAGLLDNAAAYLRTPGGGLHAYYTGTTQRCAHLAAPPPGLPVRRRLRPGPALPASTAAPTSSSRPPAAPEPSTGPPPPACCNPTASPSTPSRARHPART